MYKVRMFIVLVAVVAIPFLVSRLAGLRWNAVAMGILVLVGLICLARLWGRVDSALRRGGAQRPEV